ncbi:MAG: hypothetical protein RL220_419 [Bacteroidota bacterium]|jgi:hypothetical protein
MTIVTGKILEHIQAVYNGLLSDIVDSGNQTLLFSHFGDFNQGKVDSTLSLVESTLLESGEKRQITKRFCTILIEVLQNVSLHGSRDATGHMHAFAIISRSDTHYSFSSGNLVPREDAEHVKQKVEDINRMDENELRKVFVETLANEDLSYKGGAGLGLLTVAKRIDGKIELDIAPVSTNLSYVTVAVRMNKA